jgi:hypothetical protein
LTKKPQRKAIAERLTTEAREKIVLAEFGLFHPGPFGPNAKVGRAQLFTFPYHAPFQIEPNDRTRSKKEIHHLWQEFRCWQKTVKEFA